MIMDMTNLWPLTPSGLLAPPLTPASVSRNTWTLAPSGMLTPGDTQQEWRPVEQAAELVKQVVLEIGAPPRYFLIPPVQGSHYAGDCAINREWATKLAGRTHVLYLLAVDHARLAARGLRTPPLAYAGFTCGRAVLESCTTASWFVDCSTDVGSLCRIRRLFDFEATDLTRKYDLERNWPNFVESRGMTPAKHEELHREKCETLVNDACKLGIIKKSSSRNPLRPRFCEDNSPTNLANQYFEIGATLYQYYSAFAHGGPRVTEDHWLVRRDAQSPYRYRYHLDQAFVLIESLMIWLCRTAERIYTYAGINPEPVNETLRSAETSLGEIKASAGLEPSDTGASD